MSFNWIDWIIFGVIAYQAFLGWEAGFFPLITSFLSFVAAVWAAIAWQQPVSAFFAEKFGLAPIWSLVVAYIAIAFVVQEVVATILRSGISRIPKKIQASKVAEWLGAVVSGLNGFLIISFFLLVILSLPLRGTVKSDIQASKVGGVVTRAIQKYGGPIQSALKEVSTGARKFFTIAPQSKERIVLEVAPKQDDLRVDTDAEYRMLKLVNDERAKVKAPALVMDAKIVAVARSYSRDMFERRYFSHYSPEGEDVADRMEKAGISYQIVGENLAFAPDLMTAHTGLMESEGHRKNILDPQFHRVGIGVIVTDAYGIMVTQIFAN